MNKKPVGLRFRERDIERWKQAAAKENRTLTNWIETILNEAIHDQRATKRGRGNPAHKS
jgi:predicted HicB family RNase H-like nuclease